CNQAKVWARGDRVFCAPQEERRRDRLQLRRPRGTGGAVVSDFHRDGPEGAVRRRLHVDLRWADVGHICWLAVDLDADAVELRGQRAIDEIGGTPTSRTAAAVQSN